MKKAVFFAIVVSLVFILYSCSRAKKASESELMAFEKSTGLQAEYISYANIINGISPPDFLGRTGAEYKPSHNEDPSIPAQCWVETCYGTQNACKYCHTNYLAKIQHGNSFPIAEDQIVFAFPSPGLNRVNWKNITHPQEIIRRLLDEQIQIPETDDPENLHYIRTDNWRVAFEKSRPGGDESCNNQTNAASDYLLFPALNPNDLFPFSKEDPTQNGRHGYVDEDGFVWDKNKEHTGWRAVNFFPYGIFTPLTGSVSGIYLRLPRRFMTAAGHFSKGGTFDTLYNPVIKGMPVRKSKESSNTE